MLNTNNIRAMAGMLREEHDDLGQTARLMERAADELDEVRRQREAFETKGAEDIDLPAPRLQLRWVNVGLCRYELILPLHENDARRAVDGDDEPKANALAICLGVTRISGGNHENGSPMINGRVDTPFRDGTHIRWDAKRLGLPAYAVWRDRWTQLEARDPPRDEPVNQHQDHADV